MSTTVSDIKAALVTTLKRIKTANGYRTNVSDANIRGFYDAEWLSSATVDSAYPKIFVLLEQGLNLDQPGGQVIKTYEFSVVAVVRKLQDSYDPPAAQCEALIDDIEKAVNANRDLSGLVTQTTVTGYETDGGALDPEGCVVITVRVERYAVDGW